MQRLTRFAGNVFGLLHSDVAPLAEALVLGQVAHRIVDYLGAKGRLLCSTRACKNQMLITASIDFFIHPATIFPISHRPFVDQQSEKNEQREQLHC